VDPGAIRDIGGQWVKGQGHIRPKLDLEAWQSHRSRPLESSDYRHKINDRNVALEKGGAVAHSFNCSPVWRVCLLLTHLFLSTLSVERLFCHVRLNTHTDGNIRCQSSNPAFRYLCWMFLNTINTTAPLWLACVVNTLDYCLSVAATVSPWTVV